MSLDGKIARPDGSFDWLSPIRRRNSASTPFMREVDAVVMGRDTYEIERGMEEWPHAASRHSS